MKTYFLALALAASGALAHCGGTIATTAGSPPTSPADAGSASERGPGSDGGIVTHACLDTEADPYNCGLCGRDCQGGACVAGVCQPVVLARGEDAPASLAVDDTHVYWVNWTDPDFDPNPNTTIVRSVPKGGGDIATLGTDSPFRPTSLHVNGNSLYFYRSMMNGVPVGGAGIMRLCKDGSCPLTRIFGPGEENGLPIALDGAGIFFHEDRWLVRVDIDGSNKVLVALDDPNVLGAGFYDAAIDGTNVYAIDGTQLARFPKDGSRATVMDTLFTGSLVDVAVDDSFVFTSDSRRLVRMNKDGTGLVTLATGTPDPTNGYSGSMQALALDADRVYWLETHTPAPLNALRAVRKDGTSAATTLPLDATPYSWAFAVDATCVYWVSLDTLGPPWRGSIRKVVKPL